MAAAARATLHYVALDGTRYELTAGDAPTGEPDQIILGALATWVADVMHRAAWTRAGDRDYRAAMTAKERTARLEEPALRDVSSVDQRLLEMAVTRSKQLDEQINQLADYIMQNVPGEPSASEGAVDTAIRLLRTWAPMVADGPAPVRVTPEVAQVIEDSLANQARGRPVRQGAVTDDDAPRVTRAEVVQLPPMAADEVPAGDDTIAVMDHDAARASYRALREPTNEDRDASVEPPARAPRKRAAPRIDPSGVLAAAGVTQDIADGVYATAEAADLTPPPPDPVKADQAAAAYDPTRYNDELDF